MTETPSALAALPPETLGPDEIPRSPDLLDRETFAQLFSLTRKQRWLESRQLELLDLIDMCGSKAEQTLICDLLFRFASIHADEIPARMQELSKFLVETLKLTPSTTHLVAAERSKYSDSSQMVLWFLKAPLAKYDGWLTPNFVSGMGDAVSQAVDGDDIVLIEEFVGSGTTAAKAAKWLKDKLQERNVNATVKIVALTAMEIGAKHVQESGVEIHYLYTIKRGISDHYTGPDLANAVAAMTALEKRLSDVSENRNLKDMSFGFKKSEALYFFEGGNGVNNVFPIFWWKHMKNHARRKPVIDRTQ